jgi:hypothetical protein
VSIRKGLICKRLLDVKKATNILYTELLLVEQNRDPGLSDP